MILTVPGDKSITQRALILAGLAPGTSRLRGLLAGADPRSTAGAMRDLGVEVPHLPDDGSPMVVRGRGLRKLVPPADPLDLGNSGTGSRLLMGVLAGQPFSATLTGDASLQSRPMRRITGPLSLMGGRFEELGEPDRLPLRVHGGPLTPLEYAPPVASAQIKSALLLAGLVAGVSVRIVEPGRSRDHTERMFRQLGVAVDAGPVEGGWLVHLVDPPSELRPLEDFQVPGDLSSAAFFLVLGALGGAGRPLTVRDVGLNETRAGLLPVLERMGVRLDVERRGTPDGDVGEPIGAVTVHPGPLKAIDMGGEDVVAAIDEVPIVAAAAARAEGVTRITGAHELRVKETDRIRALVENLRAVGVRVEELEDGLEIEGSERPLKGRVRSFDDHRIAMAFGVLGALPGNRIEVEGAGCVDVSYPTFWTHLREATRGREGGSASGGRRDAAAPGGGLDASGAGPAPTDPVGTLGHQAADSAPTAPRGTLDGPGPGPAPPEPVVTLDGPAAGSAPTEPVVTLDGPAGSGKSTTAREVARRLGYRHLDSGAFYRALTWALLEAGVAPEGWPGLSEADLDAHGVGMEPADGAFRIRVGDRTLTDELRGPEVTAHVSELAKLPAVRAWLLDIQRQAGAYGGLVADGRDMGTVVFPDAEVKVFLTADLEERTRRRLRDHGVEAPAREEMDAEAARIEARDRQDSEREHSPLRRPEDAWVLDTSDLDFEAQVEAIVRRVRERTGR